MKPWRARKLAGLQSDLRQGSGRFWAVDSPWNRQVGAVSDLAIDVDESAHVADITDVAIRPMVPIYWSQTNSTLRAIHVGVNGARSVWAAIPADHDYWSAVVVDELAREVLSFRHMTRDNAIHVALGLHRTPLDGDGPQESLAAGLTLEREMLQFTIPHALRLHGPFAVGTRLQLDPEATPTATSPVTQAIARALKDYGGIVVDHTGGPLEIVVQRSDAAAGDSQGPVYRQLGISDPASPITLPLDSLRAVQV